MDSVLGVDELGPLASGRFIASHTSNETHRATDVDSSPVLRAAQRGSPHWQAPVWSGVRIELGFSGLVGYARAQLPHVRRTGSFGETGQGADH